MGTNSGIATQSAPRTDKRVIFPKYGFAGLILVLVGIALVLAFKPILQVDAVHLTERQGFANIGPHLIDALLPNPNIYVEVWDHGKVLKSRIKDSVVVGNGITFKLPGSFPLNQIGIVKVWQKHRWELGWHSAELDQVIKPGVITTGGSFHFQLMGTYDGTDKWHKVGYVGVVIGGCLLLAASIQLVRSQTL